MSWYLNYLLKNRIEIKSKADLESDEYNDLLIIEKKIEDLHKAEIVSDKEMSILKYVEDGKSLSHSKRGFGRNRISLSKNFENLCNKIAFYVGGYFTDDGYVDYMKNKYKLTNEQIDKMLDYMNSKYKNKLMRKINDN